MIKKGKQKNSERRWVGVGEGKVGLEKKKLCEIAVANLRISMATDSIIMSNMLCY